MEAQITRRPYTIGLDLGGTNAVFGIVDAQGNILEHTSIKTQQYSTAEDFVNAGVEALMPIVDKVGGINKIEGMGIGAPNSNFYDGTPQIFRGRMNALCLSLRCSATSCLSQWL